MKTNSLFNNLQKSKRNIKILRVKDGFILSSFIDMKDTPEIIKKTKRECKKIIKRSIKYPFRYLNID